MQAEVVVINKYSIHRLQFQEDAILVSCLITKTFYYHIEFGRVLNLRPSTKTAFRHPPARWRSPPWRSIVPRQTP